MSIRSAIRRYRQGRLDAAVARAKRTLNAAMRYQTCIDEAMEEHQNRSWYADGVAIAGFTEADYQQAARIRVAAKRRLRRAELAAEMHDAYGRCSFWCKFSAGRGLHAEDCRQLIRQHGGRSVRIGTD